MAFGFPRHCLLQNQMWYKIASPLISSRGYPSHDQNLFLDLLWVCFQHSLDSIENLQQSIKVPCRYAVSTRQEKSPSRFYFLDSGQFFQQFSSRRCFGCTQHDLKLAKKCKKKQPAKDSK